MSKRPVVCIGAALIDESFITKSETILATSNPAMFYRSPGGVACNIAHHLALLGHPVELISHFGNDADGKWLQEKCNKARIGVSHALTNDDATGRYVAVLHPSGELFVGAMSGHLEVVLTPTFLETKKRLLKSAALIQFDCNLSEVSLEWLLDFCSKEQIPCVIEPVSIPKASRLQHKNLNKVLLITPNREEMAELCGINREEDMKALIMETLQRGLQYLWIRKGKNGSGLYANNISIEIPAPPVEIIDITGAGDAALAGWIYAFLAGKKPDECVRYGHAMAYIILQVKGAVNEALSTAILEKTFENIYNE